MPRQRWERSATEVGRAAAPPPAHRVAHQQRPNASTRTNRRVGRVDARRLRRLRALEVGTDRRNRRSGRAPVQHLRAHRRQARAAAAPRLPATRLQRRRGSRQCSVRACSPGRFHPRRASHPAQTPAAHWMRLHRSWSRRSAPCDECDEAYRPQPSRQAVPPHLWHARLPPDRPDARNRHRRPRRSTTAKATTPARATRTQTCASGDYSNRIRPGPCAAAAPHTSRLRA